MITYREVDRTFLGMYDTVPMLVNVKSVYTLEKLNNGLGGVLFIETPVVEYVKDLGKYEKATEYETTFDITNWAFFMAFDNEKPIGAATVASKTKNVHMLDARDDLCVLWDIRVDGDYKHQGVGTTLF